MNKRLLVATQFAIFLQVSTCAIAEISSGTGFFLTADGHIATNYHVVKNGNQIAVRDFEGNTFPAKVLLTDAANDLALLKIESKSKPIPTVQSSYTRKGDPVFTIGFPNISLQGLASKFTEGTISSLSGIQDQPTQFQISVPIQPGNSGGPLINDSGNVVGIVVAKLSAEAALRSGSTIPESVNYAIKSNYLLELINLNKSVSNKIKLTKTSVKRLALADLVANAEPSVVLILSSTDNKPLIKEAAPPERDSPKSNQKPNATSVFAKGLDAFAKEKYNEAFDYFKVASAQGHAEASYRVGYMLFYGKGVPKNWRAASTYFELAAEKSHSESMFYLGRMNETGSNDFKANNTEAIRWYSKAAALGDKSAIYRVETLRDRVNRPKEPKIDSAILAGYKKSARGGDAKFQLMLGDLYESGDGVEVDYQEAALWYQMAAEQGVTMAQSRLGILLSNPVKLNNKGRAIKWLLLASEKGDDAAIRGLGSLYAYDKPDGEFRRNAEISRVLLEQANNGNKFAQFEVGRLYQNGWCGLLISLPDAIAWYQKAANQGHPASKVQLDVLVKDYQ